MPGSIDTVCASARISAAVDLPSSFDRAAILRALPRISEAFASNAFCRSTRVPPSSEAAVWRNSSTSACTGSSHARVMPSRRVVTLSRTLRRALYRGPRPAPEGRPQLPPLVSSRVIWLSDQETTLSSCARTASSRAAIAALASRASSCRPARPVRVASCPEIRLHQNP